MSANRAPAITYTAGQPATDNLEAGPATMSYRAASLWVLGRARFPVLRDADLRIGEVKLAAAHE